MYSVNEILNFKLVTLAKTVNSQVDPCLKEAAIPYSHYATLLIIFEYPGIRQADLAQLRVTDRTTVGHTIDRLEQLAYVERRKDAVDRRAFHLHLTERGEQVVKDYWEQVRRIERQVLKNLSDSEVEQLLGLLDKGLKGDGLDGIVDSLC